MWNVTASCGNTEILFEYTPVSVAHLIEILLRPVAFIVTALVALLLIRIEPIAREERDSDRHSDLR